MYRRILVIAFSIPIVACQDPTGPAAPSTVPDVRPYVTGEALAALDHRGRFVFPTPSATDGKPTLDPTEAHRVAAVLLRDFVVAPTVEFPCHGGFSCSTPRQDLEKQACGPIAWSQVVLRPEWYYGETPYTIAGELPANVHNHFGPKYYYTVFDRGVRLATVVVATRAANLVVGSNGRLEWSSVRGGEFDFYVIPCRSDAAVPPLAEEAVRFAAIETDRKVTRLPLLLNPGRRVGAGGARWRIVLDLPVQVVGRIDGLVRAVDTIYVSVWPNSTEPTLPATTGLRLMVPAEHQPTAEAIMVLRSGVWEVVELPRVPDRPIDYIEVSVVH
jgi:hypothetical protein